MTARVTVLSGKNGLAEHQIMNTGDLTENMPRFQLQPLTNERDDIEALAVNMLGFASCCGSKPRI
jgi:hypothetical protein